MHEKGGVRSAAPPFHSVAILDAFAAELVGSSLEAAAVSHAHIDMAGAVAIRLVRLAHQAPGTGVLAAFAFEVHSNLRDIGAPLWRTRVIGRFSSEYIIMTTFYQTNP